MVKLAIAGSAGRMGRQLLKVAIEDTKATLAAGFVAEGSSAIGQDLGILAGLDPTGIKASTDMEAALDAADVVIDFTTPELTVTLASLCASKGKALITGTTGLSPEQQKQLEQAAKHIPIVQSFNMSLGVNVLTALVEQAARFLDDRFDIEILEMHHKHKVDAPSGTALMLGEAAASGRNVRLPDVQQTVRDGHTGPRIQGDIGFAVLRGGGVIGEHRVMLADESERIELAHISQSRAIYANGAVAAAQWVVKQPASLYSMRDVLGL